MDTNMDKIEIYESLKNDGAKLKAINFYTLEQLQGIYQDRFEPSDNSEAPPEYHHEEPNTEKLNDGDYEYHNSDDEENDSPETEYNSEDVTEIRTLIFDRGGWCDELGASYAPGIYRPATVEEFMILKKYAKEVL